MRTLVAITLVACLLVSTTRAQQPPPATASTSDGSAATEAPVYSEGAQPPGQSDPRGPKSGFRDLKWGDRPKPGWSLDKLGDDFFTHTERTMSSKDGQVLGVYTIQHKYIFDRKSMGLCAVEIKFAGTTADAVLEKLVALWGPPATTDGGRSTWEAQHPDGLTDAVFHRHYQNMSNKEAWTKALLGASVGGDPGPVLRLSLRGCGATAASNEAAGM